jgi:hypothetical protein
MVHFSIAPNTKEIVLDKAIAAHSRWAGGHEVGLPKSIDSISKGDRNLHWQRQPDDDALRDQDPSTGRLWLPNTLVLYQDRVL